MDKPTSRIFFSFPTRLLCFLVLFAKVFFPTTFSLHISLRLEKRPLPSLINESYYVTSIEYGVNISHRTEANWARNSNHRDALCWSASSCYLFHSIQPRAIKTLTCRDWRQLRSRPGAQRTGRGGAECHFEGSQRKLRKSEQSSIYTKLKYHQGGHSASK